MSLKIRLQQFLLLGFLVYSIQSNTPIKEYLVRRDAFSGFKAAEYSVYDKDKKHLYYRIESKVSILQNVELRAQPSKKVIGRLNAKLNLLTYKGEFSILNQNENQWINGEIKQNFQMLGTLFSIEWNGKRINMESEPVSLTYRFFDVSGKLLAECRFRLSSMFWAAKYDLRIFSNEFPEELYLLVLAARDRASGAKSG